MIFLVVALTAIAVGLLVFGLANVTPAEERAVHRRLATIQTGATSYRDLQERRRRQQKRDRLASVLEALGERVSQNRTDLSKTRLWLMYAGIRHANAVSVYIASRLVLALMLGFGGFVGIAVMSQAFGLAIPAMTLWLITGMLGLLGWLAPFFYVDGRVKNRQSALSRALPDTLDLLVVCVEAGLGLNQALVRVSDEVDRISPEMSDELTVVNLEIRAGTPRDEALRRLGERTGVDDIRSLTSMLLQTDRFGTSIADALRVHSDTLRTKRMQKAEEAAAKTTVKMLFPLIFFIFPAIFVVLVGPAVFLFRDFFQGLG
ncbi:MAG: type II secretion system F family protein [Gemmatimonadota bacterium]|nr:type II secretion system F family protein [Gemmatimonadota bacterium]